METTVILAIIEMAAKYGIPAVVEAIKAWNVEKINQADLDMLEALVARPETYFNPNPGS